MKKFLLTLLGVFLALPTFARNFTYEYEGQTLKYTVSSDIDKTVYVSSNKNISGDLIIPSEIIEEETGIEYTVIKIGSEAFFECTKLTSVTFPESLQNIARSAFYGCTALTKAEFASIESLCSIKFDSYDANPLYYAHHLYINGAEVTEVKIPTTIQSIGNYTFYGCSQLTEIIIPESVQSIGNYAFSSCI